MRIFVTGNRGQLGRQLMLAFPNDEIDGADLPELDITDEGLTRRAIETARPGVVIHAAALTDTRLCEDDPDLALRVNGLGTRNVALACRDAGAALVYVSTNEVFDGTKREPYFESDAPNPINAYGRSKLAGEEQAQAIVERLYIVRTSWLWGGGERDFPSRVLAAASEKPELTMVTDEIATPTYARDLAAAIARLVATGVYGIYHFTNAGECSRFDWAREVLRLAGRSEVALKPTTLAEYNPYPPKPPYTVLRNDAVEDSPRRARGSPGRGARLGITLRPWQTALAEHFSS
ncbi:MAG: dTDP-4-dehydrorhamnose reductase [Dehalococcoidia bacterium]|jgi:dTDP-4-dehydrorhamnose reductase